jgi:hypothetical protein
MYANLQVIVRKRNGERVELFAHKVEHLPDHVAVHIDEQDGQGNEAIPAGVARFPHDVTLTIYPDF